MDKYKVGDYIQCISNEEVYKIIDLYSLGDEGPYYKCVSVKNPYAYPATKTLLYYYFNEAMDYNIKLLSREWVSILYG